LDIVLAIKIQIIRIITHTSKGEKFLVVLVVALTRVVSLLLKMADRQARIMIPQLYYTEMGYTRKPT
jgi:hypothetical protein